MNFHNPIRTLAAVAVLMAAAVPALAQSVALAPAQIVQTFKPGTPFELQLTTNNTGPATVQMSVEISDFWYDAKSAKTFPPPGASQKMKAIVTAPADARGGYYAVLFVSSAPKLSDEKTKDGGAVFTRMRLGCLVMLEADGAQEYKVIVGDPTIDPPTASSSLVAHIPIANDSNTHIFPQPKLTVLDANRKIVAKAESDSKRFLPGQKFLLDLMWDGELKPGTYS